MKLEARNLSYFSPRGKPLVKGLSLEIQAGERVALLGPNGSGKSTLLRLLASALKPHEGEVLLGGRNIARIPQQEVARSLAWLPQKTTVLFDLSAEEIVSQGLFSQRHLSVQEQQQRIREAMHRADITDLRDRLATTLSGGEFQRVMLARALAQGSPLLLLDEPTAALDIKHQLEILKLLRQLSRQGVGIFAALHDLEAALDFDRVLVLDQGQLIAEGPPAEVLQIPQVSCTFGVKITPSSDGTRLIFELPGTSI